MAMPLFVAALLLVGCDGDDCGETCGNDPRGGTSTSTTSTSTGTSCTLTTGMLSGTVSLFEPPGGPNHLPAPEALVELRREPDDEPLNAMANADSRYEVELPPGTWIVGGESADGYCTTFDPQTVTVEVCETTSHDVVLEACVN